VDYWLEYTHLIENGQAKLSGRNILCVPGSDLGNCSILQRKGPKRGEFLGLRRAFWGLKTPFLGDRDAKG
jgi:hypothetical protein